MKGTAITLNSETSDLDIKVTRNSSGMITGGLVVDDVQKQNKALLIYMHPGEIKEHPQIGVGIASMLLSSETLLYKHKMRKQLEADGFQINHLEIETTPEGKVDIQINANY
ncbi:hypothetical protein D0T49_00380 [Paludibacter sp. 221]|uniref:hypothetical protein n=1 Tax=Paludibacter sp. 221 TaxID=2302939 RepID=UPI0013D36372|nr:hypothetical protein [Paludibacter sp. 221]NDV45509.1 hypothetical protein [Paludibacter sp. 221]